MHLYYFEKLDVWQGAKQFAVEVYRLTADFPATEKFGLTSQIRRASLSVSANIAEGMSRQTVKDKRKFLNQAYSSAIEVLSFLIIAKELGFLQEIDYQNSRAKIEKITNQISALAKVLK